MKNSNALLIIGLAGALFITQGRMDCQGKNQFPKVSKHQAKRLDRERKASISDLKRAIKEKNPKEAMRQMRILMGLYYNEKSAKEVSKYLIKVIETRFTKNEPKFMALQYLKEIGKVGIKALETAILSRLRRQPLQIRLKAITTLVEAGEPSSWHVLLRLGNDRDNHIAVAAIKGLSAWKNLPPRELKKLVRNICSKLRPPTKEEIEKDLDLPPVQIALREVLSEITGKKKETVKEWKKFVNVWVRNGCPVLETKEILEKNEKNGKLKKLNFKRRAEKSYPSRIAR